MRRFDGSVPAGSVRLRPMTESFWVVGLELNPNLNNELQSFWVVGLELNPNLNKNYKPIET